MPFRPVSPEKLSAAVVRQVEELILRGILLPGKRLPAERELAERLGVSRPSLREAIAQLQDAGLLVSKPGAGIFVADVLASAFSPALADLFSRHNEAAMDYLSFRKDMEGLAAERAARLGSDTDLAVITAVFRKMEQAQETTTPEEEAALDAQFHMAIIEASHNVVMLHMMRSMYDLLRDGVFYNRQIMFKQQTKRTVLLDQHRTIHDALINRDADGARAAVEAHMSYVERALLDQQRAERHEDVAQQRLDQENDR
ncbi:FadR/GntR family transcriptional regulator [Sulfitobacter donghicola]|uniref:Pyruvate dehydrogenase complex repressor n=1 Tax=Sulfitobacter donghicola DSW-25 = KCTC 12864 = JCM 14565 TaxID=1300350 RepID=A0A073INB5_9RHOB|nr:FCD domain-containing protein [Sulfitobacter donghicola]KEJ90976.1 GntR family transcriptional regulator [Sulfitobacter donghicola DSW-25 = KCTC 12864 = JCM 14565]KIN68270.1 Pyruvate dehydrogenase complex repressor [Sulfitobacter donghicola DSW-25 = KCTC 12864 = JCM 14565]